MIEREIAIHGGGYVGLTAAVHFANADWRVVLYDPDRTVVDAINAGQPKAGDFLAYLHTSVAQLVRDGHLQATHDLNAALWPEVHLVAVPTERGGEPDDTIVLAVLRTLIDKAPPHSAILIESTLTPGTVDALVARGDQPEHPRDVADHHHLAVCPRRDWFADPEKNLATLPRVVGGYRPCCTARATEILTTVSPTIFPTSYRTAELTKALENALFHLPIMLGHQLASALPEHDVAEALALAATHWRFKSFGGLYLGFGAGGRCVPLGTKYLVNAARTYQEGLDPEQMGRSNHHYRRYLYLGQEATDTDQEFRVTVAEVVWANECTRPVVLGMAYRPGFKDAGSSPGLDVARTLHARGLTMTSVHDPLWTPEELAIETGLATVHDAPLACQSADAILLATPHPIYRGWPEHPGYWRPGQLVIDGSGTWAPYRERLRDQGVDYRQVGTAGWMRGK